MQAYNAENANTMTELVLISAIHPTSRVIGAARQHETWPQSVRISCRIGAMDKYKGAEYM